MWLATTAIALVSVCALPGARAGWCPTHSSNKRNEWGHRHIVWGTNPVTGRLCSVRIRATSVGQHSRAN